MLRLDWNLVFTVINLLILYVLMRKFLFKPVNEILEKRQKEEDARLADAEAAKNSALKSKEEYEASIKNAEQEKAQIVAKAREEAAGEYSRIVDEAQKKAGTIVEKACSDSEQEKKKIMQQAETAVRDMVVTAAARVAGEKEGTDNDRALYDEFLRQQ